MVKFDKENCMFQPTCARYANKGIEACNKWVDIPCDRFRKLNDYYDMALLTSSQRGKIDLWCGDDEPDIKVFEQLVDIESNIVSFINQGKNIYIHSEQCGNGKTSWAIRLMQKYFTSVWKKAGVDACLGLFIEVPRFLLETKSNITVHSDYVEHIKKYVLDADLVIWDEVATKSLTEFEHEQLLSLINARINLGKSNIYTSNLPPSLLREKLGDRLYSRVVNGSIEMVFNNEDKRGLQ